MFVCRAIVGYFHAFLTRAFVHLLTAYSNVYMAYGNMRYVQVEDLSDLDRRARIHADFLQRIDSSSARSGRIEDDYLLRFLFQVAVTFISNVPRTYVFVIYAIRLIARDVSFTRVNAGRDLTLIPSTAFRLMDRASENARRAIGLDSAGFSIGNVIRRKDAWVSRDVRHIARARKIRPAYARHCVADNEDFPYTRMSRAAVRATIPSAIFLMATRRIERVGRCVNARIMVLRL